MERVVNVGRNESNMACTFSMANEMVSIPVHLLVKSKWMACSSSPK